jgi:coenzyme F420-reducing hydrogenase delta subunit
VENARKVLEEIGLEGQRLQMINLSSAMGGQFAFAAAEITAEIRRLGPNKLRANGQIASQTDAIVQGEGEQAPDEH